MNPDSWIQVFCRSHRQIKAMGKSLRELARPHDLSVKEAVLLLVCAEEREIGFRGYAQSEISQLTTMSPAAVSGHLDALRQRGWIAGSRDDNDRRRQTWTATADGQEIANTITARLTQLTAATLPTTIDQETVIKPTQNEAA